MFTDIYILFISLSLTFLAVDTPINTHEQESSNTELGICINTENGRERERIQF